MTLSVIVRGFILGLSLIVAIGAQNAFVLKQGLKKEHIFLVAAICSVSDIMLIAAGLGGMGVMVERFPELILTVGKIGIAFLIIYGIRSLRDAFRGQWLVAGQAPEVRDWKAVSANSLAFTWLNPHVYLDTVVLIGGIGLQFDATERIWFGLGAGSASVLWFFGLAYGAAVLSPYFAKEGIWRGLHLLIAGIMFWTAYWIAAIML
jgi:L-lysine exporter family protein LysE/ArgO